MKSLLLPIVLIAAVSAPSAAAEPPVRSSASGACTRAESWHYGPTIPKDWRDQMARVRSGSALPVWGFTQALAYRQLAPSAEARVLAEFWISRALYEAQLKHIAWAGFAAIASRPVDPRTVGIQIAALECLSAIHALYPTLELPEAASSRLGEYLGSANPSEHRALIRYAGQYARSLIGSNAPGTEVTSALALLKGSGAEEWLDRGIASAKEQKHQDAIQNLERFLHAPIPSMLKGYVDQAHLLIARAYYSTGQFSKAVQHDKLVSKSSNELATALSELAWAQLMEGHYGESIGSAISLQQGGLRHAFAPEAPMVMAMALNEICQYPESLQAVSSFRKSYEKPYRWISNFLSQKDPRAPYPLAVRYLKKENVMPVKVGSEWTRTPGFIANQEEINLLIDEQGATRELGRSGSREQKRLATEIRKLSGELKEQIRNTRRHSEELPLAIRDALGRLRTLLVQYERFRRGAPVWRVILAHFQKGALPRRESLVAAIDRALMARTRRMAEQLDEIAENNQLIQVEIYNGASQDVIWQNAHPDYKKIAQQIRDQRDEASAAKVWDWGRTIASGNGGGEIWEDELGSFKADLFDNCSSKEKYLALKRLSYSR